MTKRHPYEALRQVAVIAGGIWLEHAHKQPKSRYVRAAYVPYKDLERLRAALEAAGYDMEAALKRFKQQDVVEQTED